METAPSAAPTQSAADTDIKETPSSPAGPAEMDKAVIKEMPTHTGNEDPTLMTGLTEVDRGAIKEVLKSDLIILENNKRYKLDNIRVPPFRDGEALEFLRTFTKKKVLVYIFTKPGQKVNRQGIPLVHVLTQDDGVWLQQEIVSKGFAWAYSEETNLQMYPPLRAIEEEARSKRMGMWDYEAYQIKNPENVANYLETYQIVEGTILDATRRDENTYFNFGRDWKSDFTIRVSHKVWNSIIPSKAWENAPRSEILGPVAWERRKVRIRGWVEDSNGPAIELLHPEQIEFFPEVKPKKPAAPASGKTPAAPAPAKTK